jgi:UDP-N-acetylmuramate--alanine ligase
MVLMLDFVTASPTIHDMARSLHRPIADLRKDETFDVVGTHAYLIGIGGCGMSGLARMLLRRGAKVSGSDRDPSDTTDQLIHEGITVGFDQSRQWLPDVCDLVVASAAVKPDHPQMLEAQRRGIPVMLYAEALGKCMIGRTGIAIAGTHGKSTTTAMLGSMLVDAGLDPSVIIGATYSKLEKGNLSPATGIGVGFRMGANAIPVGGQAGKPGVLVAEACEYNRSFHNFRPTLACITSVEADHMDCYSSLDEIVQSFREFALLLPAAKDGGKFLIAHDGANRREVTAGLDCEVRTIGFSPQADYVVGYDPTSRKVMLTHERATLGEWTLKVPGAHNATNSATAFVLGMWAGADPGRLAASAAEFTGADRRSQLMGEKPVVGKDGSKGVVRVIDDYGHHPTEVDATLKALREFDRPQDRGGRLICVFQPHQHSRTRHLLEEFANSFSSADVVIVPHIYFVRDSQEERQKVTAGDLVDRLRDKGVRAMHLYPFEAIVEQLDDLCQPGDLVVVMGAGPVWQVGKGFLAKG